jgi:GT2 family glycosyltransferase
VTSGQADAPLVSVLVVSHETRALTLACLASLGAQTTIPHEVIVLDNASADGSPAAIAAAFPEARLIESPANLGFAAGCNAAAEVARGRYLLLLNPDTVVLDHAVDRLVAFAAARPQAGIWGGSTRFADGSLNPASAFGDLTLWSLFCRASGLAVGFPASAWLNPEDYGGWDRASEREVAVVSGAFLLVSRALWQHLGGFDPAFVMYGEEADFCRRARGLRLARPRVTPEATIIHHIGASSAERADRDALILKAKATLIRRHLPGWQRPPALALLALWPWTRMVGGRLLARLTANPRHAATADRWAAAWRRRADWMPGYPASTRERSRP